jgi:hypothetical protein
VSGRARCRPFRNTSRPREPRSLSRAASVARSATEASATSVCADAHVGYIGSAGSSGGCRAERERAQGLGRDRAPPARRRPAPRVRGAALTSGPPDPAPLVPVAHGIRAPGGGNGRARFRPRGGGLAPSRRRDRGLPVLQSTTPAGERCPVSHCGTRGYPHPTVQSATGGARPTGPRRGRSAHDDQGSVRVIRLGPRYRLLR